MNGSEKVIITSSSNEQIKNIIQLKEKAKVRKQTGNFVVEGIKMFREIPEKDLVCVYVSESFIKTHNNSEFFNNMSLESDEETFLKTNDNVLTKSDDSVSVKTDDEVITKSDEEKFKIQVVSDQVFKKISDTVTPQGILAVVRQKRMTVSDIIKNRKSRTIENDYEKERLVSEIHVKKGSRKSGNNTDDLKDRSCIIVLDRLQDPGNLGTIIRTGEGAGISGVIMSRDCVDIYSPKVIRSTMGSIFRVPFAVTDDLPSVVLELKKAGVITYAAHLKGEDFCSRKPAADCAFLIGNESGGLSEEISSLADKLIKIPMEGRVESLNAAVATSILMYAHKLL